MEDKTTNIERVTYMDGMILVADNVNQLPVDERAFRPDMFIVLICNQGRLQTDINGRQHLIEAGDMLLCNSFHTLTDALHSIDFSCSIYCFPGTSSAWIRERLIEKIRYYLLNTSLSAKEIAHRVDMPNSSFFGKFVKQHFGCTPMEYRNKQRNSEP